MCLTTADGCFYDEWYADEEDPLAKAIDKMMK